MGLADLDFERVKHSPLLKRTRDLRANLASCNPCGSGGDTRGAARDRRLLWRCQSPCHPPTAPSPNVSFGESPVSQRIEHRRVQLPRSEPDVNPSRGVVPPVSFDL